jgi:hypothetical protein
VTICLQNLILTSLKVRLEENMLHLAKIGGNFQMKKEMSKLNLGRANPKEIVEGILLYQGSTRFVLFVKTVSVQK